MMTLEKLECCPRCGDANSKRWHYDAQRCEVCGLDRTRSDSTKQVAAERAGLMPIEKHFVRFFSPGTFMSEITDKPVQSWDIKAAQKMAHTITERYNATPYAFQFITRSRGDDDLDSHEAATSPLYYLGGKVETLAEIEARNDPKEEILRFNMRGNGWDKVIVNDNSWRVTRPLMESDVILDWKPKKRNTA